MRRNRSPFAPSFAGTLGWMGYWLWSRTSNALRAANSVRNAPLS